MNKPLILVVEDDAPVRNLITTTLKLQDYRFLTAGNGETALLEASSHNPDIILLDLGLPDIDGIDVIRQIRSWRSLRLSSSAHAVMIPIKLRPSTTGPMTT